MSVYGHCDTQAVLELARKKAAELEDFSSPNDETAATAGASGGTVSRKRAAVGEAEGAARARAFLSEFAALPLDSLPKEEAAARVKGLCDGLASDAQGNPWLSEVLQCGA
jgi:DNA mismatch repair protein MSH2